MFHHTFHQPETEEEEQQLAEEPLGDCSVRHCRPHALDSI